MFEFNHNNYSKLFEIRKTNWFEQKVYYSCIESRKKCLNNYNFEENFNLT